MIGNSQLMAVTPGNIEPATFDGDAVEAAQQAHLLNLRRARRRRQTIVWLARIAIAVVFLGAWEYAARHKLIDTFFFSSPSAVFGFLQTMFVSGSIWRDIAVTLESTLLGFGLAAATAIPFGLLLARFSALDQVLAPYLAALNALPRVALAPMFILWFGIGIASKIVLVVSLVFFIILINTEAGIKAADSELLRLAQVMGATPRQRFMKIVLPGAVPAIFAGMRLGVIYALLGTVVGEMVAAEAGLGQLVSLYSGTYRTGGVLATLLILSIIGVGMNAIALLVERRLLMWQR
jgi:NitT/TauT family transport system permease protein